MIVQWEEEGKDSSKFFVAEPLKRFTPRSLSEKRALPKRSGKLFYQ